LKWIDQKGRAKDKRKSGVKGLGEKNGKLRQWGTLGRSEGGGREKRGPKWYVTRTDCSTDYAMETVMDLRKFTVLQLQQQSVQRVQYRV